MATYLIDSYSETNQDTFFTLGIFSRTQFGQTFAVTTDLILDSCKFYMCKANSPSGNFTAKVYAMTGTFGTNGVPTGSALAISDPIVASSISTSFTLYTLNFTGANRITLVGGVNYCILIDYPGADRIKIGEDVSSPSHGGNAFSFVSPNYTAGTGDTCFYVYGSDLNISVSDSTAVTDTPTIFKNIQTMSVTDSSAITDTPTLYITTRFLSVVDSTAVSDTVTLFQTFYNISVSDSTNVLDTPTIQKNIQTMSVIDSSIISDTFSFKISDSLISVADSTSIADAITLFQTSYNLSVADSTAISDIVTLLQTSYKISVSDSTIVTDTPTIFIPTNYLSVADSTTISDSATISKILSISVSDQTIVCENEISYNNSTKTYNDTSTTYNGFYPPTIEIISFINVSDSTVVTDTPTLYSFGNLNISVSDSSAVTDTPTIQKNIQTLSVADSTAISENVTLFQTSYNISVSDSTAVTDTPNISLGTLPTINISITDSTTISDTITLFQTSYNLSVSDSTAVSDTSIILIPTLMISIADSTAVSDTVTLLKILYISVSDSTTISDTPTILIPTLKMNISEILAVSEIFIFKVSDSQILVVDSISVSDLGILSLRSYISVSDSTAVSEAMNFVRVDGLHSGIIMRSKENDWPKGLDQRVSKPIELKDKEVPPGITKEKDFKMNSKENQYPLPMDDKIIR